MLDQQKKHGIASSNSSRLGGIVIFFSLMAYLAVSPYVNQTFSGRLLQAEEQLIVDYGLLALLIALVGFADDLRQGITPSFRMLLLFAISFFGFYMNPQWIPGRFFVEVLGWLEVPFFFLLLATSFVLIGFVNAGNMVDGANGLLGSIAVAHSLLAYDVTGSYYFLALALATASFVLVNVTTPRIILGDFGAYGLGAIIALSSFHLYQVYELNVWFFAAMLTYPCLEILRIITVRLIMRRSPLVADNQHIHNKMHSALLGFGIGSFAANSITGLFLGWIFSGAAFLLHYSGALLATNEGWGQLFLVNILIFLVLWALIEFLTRPNSKAVEQGS